MFFNSPKCEFLRITNRKDIIHSQYTIQNIQIHEVQQAKYLGVTFNAKLKWSDHIQIICKKANSVLGFLHQNFNTCPVKVKSLLYQSLVRPILEYACTVWAWHSQIDIQRIKAVQRRAARFALNRYGRYQSITGMLDELNWPTLQARRSQLKLMMLFKITRGLVHVQNNLPLTYSNTDNIFRGHSFKFTQLETRVDCYKFSFFPSTISLWNTLPPSVVGAETFNEFKNSVIFCT